MVTRMDARDEQTQEERRAALVKDVARAAGAPPADVRVVRSPYRICPLGAHVDHQLGQVTGLALSRALLLGFVRSPDRRTAVASRNFPGTVEFSLDGKGLHRAGDWGDYARGAALALQKRHTLRRGITALVDGHNDVGGLSSSAAVGVAYLLAFEAANDLCLSPKENIELDRILENDFIGLNNGILDQATILLSRRGCLMHLDCQTGESRLEPCGDDSGFCIVVLFSGLRQPLSETNYNRRVEECRQAARILLEAAALPVPESPRLRHVPPEVFTERSDGLPEALRRRAEHFFGEQERVAESLKCWTDGDLEGFGRLMSESGLSSIRNYECGNRYLRSGCEILRATPGVYGARFSGAGFRGCCIGLAESGREDEIGGHVLGRYLDRHPDMKGNAGVYFCACGDGAGLI